MKKLFLFSLFCFLFFSCVSSTSKENDKKFIKLYQTDKIQEYVQKMFELAKKENPSMNLNLNIFGSDKKAALITSILAKRKNLVSLILQDAGINLKDSNAQVEYIGDTFLDIAVVFSTAKIVSLLLEYKADPNFEQENVGNSLMLALKSKNPEKREIVKRLLFAKVNLNTKFIAGDGAELNPLMLSLIVEGSSFYDIIKYQKNNLDQKNNLGLNALSYASIYNNIEGVSALLKYGADINFQLKDGFIPIYFACGKSNLQIVKLLYEKGGNINFRGAKNENCLMATANSKNKESREVFEFVLKHAKNLLNLRFDKENLNANILYFLSLRDKFVLLKKMIEEYKMNYENISNNQKNPILILARYSKQGKQKKIQYFLDKGIDVNSEDKQGFNVLFALIFSYSENSKILSDVKFLVEKGVDLKHKSKDDETVLDVLEEYLDEYKNQKENADAIYSAKINAEIKNLLDIIKYLKSKGAK